VRLFRATLNPNRMATSFQLFKNIEKQIWARLAKKDVAPALEAVMLMRYDNDARHIWPFWLPDRFLIKR